MLSTHEEIQDMVCSICMDFMAVDQVIVKTFCGIDPVEYQHQHNDSSSNFNSELHEIRAHWENPEEVSGPASPVNPEIEQARLRKMLKGHKFHYECF
mmetsp:Transcript_5857/g.9444  ORF Transcript_5857/g.9444 Transcript_5857/m.9444 type:complete len:97 (+) Transcript_5857:1338-1628(+)